MRKIFGVAMMLALGGALSAQYMIVGKDSISLQQFKKDNAYGLENTGVENTINTTTNFYLFQQFAADKKADTLTYFREKMADKEGELRGKYFFPTQIIDPVLNAYVKDNQTEKEVQVFILEKTPGDTIDYLQVYNDVKSGKMTMEDAISKYTKSNPKPLYLKPGSLDNQMYSAIKNLPNNTMTQFFDTPSYVGFAKVLNSRPSLGYMVFGTISFPKDENAATIKESIYKDLKAGKTFQEVAKLYGANEHEKDNGGVIMGSPTLPDEVYELFKGQKAGYYTPEPLLFVDKYFVFNIYNVEPYVLTEKNRAFFLREMNNSLYAETLQDNMTAYLKTDPSYKEFPAFNQVKKSYANLIAAKDSEVLFQYKGEKVTAGFIKEMIGDKKEDAAKLTPAVWAEAIQNINGQELLRIYSKNFTKLKNVKEEMEAFKKSLYSDYIFSKYLTEEMAKHPEWLTEQYNQNKAKYFWGERAEGRVAIIDDPKLTKEIAKDIKDAKNWETLKAKFAGKLNAKKQVLVQFEKGEMSKEADVFTQYNVPFKTGVHETKMGDKTLVIAVDKLLAPSQMTQEEAAEELRDAVNEKKLNEIIALQKAKTKIVIQPEFLKDLEKNFKK
ncbi:MULTISPECIES: peptidylprolyl isomerase [unclassified Kaistella]|uniref:peptidylprolyl isomerase n=1 Tax=unclassified Kaistella TaxID=2762626 RepID=UPI0027341BCB|nr:MULTISPECIES: peptidylprolyl isomerase [unclassified Kaistella]MDP2453282.1 peptidylprolyl isomerase [Kaistella sp. SH11-4b]MDP2456339.1 peptidylprolyl isomerase [Kaistella sp. SH40-3]MDP2459095.1 peptidylprolyl isomerase [Kaistella sp. SH19-2b]